MSFFPHLVILLWRFVGPLQRLMLRLVNKHVGSQVSWHKVGLGAKGAVESLFRVVALVRVLFSRPSNCLLCRRRGWLARLLSGALVFEQSVLAAVRLHVLGKGKPSATFRAAEGLLAGVQVLMLMEEAAVLEGLATDVAQVRAHVVGVLAPVVFHDGVMFEN